MSSIIRATTTSGLQVAPDNSGSLQLQTNGTTAAVTIDTSQNVGIGTTSPGYKLHVKGGNADNLNVDNSGQQYTELDFSNNGTVKASLWWDNSNTLFRIQSGVASSSLTFATAGTEKMRIDSSGNVLVGKTATDLATAGAEIRAAGYGIFTVSGDYAVYARRNTSTGQVIAIRYAGTDTGSISTNGTNTAYATSSDYRLKENIAPMTGALDKIAQLKPVTYTWKSDGSASEGFIAHELQEVCPHAVIGEKDAVNEDGTIKPQGIDTSFLVATLTAAIQEQQTIINDLKARIETLEAK